MRSRGEGTISQRSDGRWAAKLQVNGKRHSVYGATRAEVAEKLRDLQNQSAAGRLVPAAKTTVGNIWTSGSTR